MIDTIVFKANPGKVILDLAATGLEGEILLEEGNVKGAIKVFSGNHTSAHRPSHAVSLDLCLINPS